MRTYAALTLFIALMAMASASAQQACWTPVVSWQASDSLSANSNGTINCGSGSSCQISLASTGNPNFFLAGLNCTNPDALWQSSKDTVTTATIQNSSSTPCPPEPPLMDNLTGTGGAASNSQLHIFPSSSTYTFGPLPSENYVETWSGCGGNGGQTNGNYVMSPGNTWPLTFSLPASVQTLTASPSPFQQTTPYQNAIVPWTFSFTLDPKYTDCDECKKKGGQGEPISSSIGTQNQSLGEDIPIAGTGFNLHYEGSRASGANGNAVATNDAMMTGGWTLSIHHAYDIATNTLFLGDGSQRNGYLLGALVMLNNQALFASEDGSEVYVFARTQQGTAQHVQTLRPQTGALIYQFGYDAAGMLVTVTDASGNVTTIQRDGSEHPTAIVAPFSQTTTLTTDANGFLSQVTDPLGNSTKLSSTSTGLLMSRTDANGNLFNYTYDGNGKLIKDADPVGGFITLGATKAQSGFGSTVTSTSSMGRTSSYQDMLNLPWIMSSTSTSSEQRAVTWPNGLKASSATTVQNGQITRNITLPDGTASSNTQGPDPRFGLQVPVPVSGTQMLGNLTMTMSGSRTATLGTPGNPFTLTTQTDTQTVNGRIYKSVFTTSNKTYVDTTPVKRTTTTVLDSLERPISVQVGALLPLTFAYDSAGRLSTIKQGTRTTTLGYDANGSMNSITDPLSLITSFTHDADGQVLTTTLPDGRMITYTYDANGNLTSVTPPGKSAHDFAYTAVDLTSVYTPPTLPGTGATNYTYNADRDMTTFTRPDGETITFGYDSAGRRSSATTPTETVNYTYDATTGNLSTASISGGEAIAYGYNGPLPTSSTWTGTVAGSVSRAYNNNFWVTSESINNSTAVNLIYDNDGLLNKAGALIVKRDPKDGFVTGTTLGGALDTFKYDTFGQLIGYTAKFKVGLTITTLDAVAYTPDADGRISAKTETIGGKKTAYSYIYDQAGRLATVKQNGAAFSSYTYDANSNRLSATTSSGTVTGTYDAQDRLLTYGNASYTYTANGELASQMVGSQTTTYSYDVLGNLIAATLPNGTKITYLIDAENHRVGKEVNGALQAGFLYDGDQLVGQLNGSNQIVSQFVYGTSSTSPDYMVSGGATYRIVTDQLGSPRLVVNTTTGAIVEQIDYDEFGNVLKDTSPGFQPFGFAGGLYDQDTKLVRFGARDYNASTGRWTAKDPIRFAGGDSNLYGYVHADPVNLSDPAGLSDFWWGVGDRYVELQTQSLEMICPCLRGIVAIKDHISEPISEALNPLDRKNYGYPTAGKSLSEQVGGTPDKGSASYYTGQTAVDLIVDYFTLRFGPEGKGTGPKKGAGVSKKAMEDALRRGKKIGKCGRYTGNKPGVE